LDDKKRVGFRWQLSVVAVAVGGVSEFVSECTGRSGTYPLAASIGALFPLAVLASAALAVWVLVRNIISYSAGSTLVSGFTTAIGFLLGALGGGVLWAMVFGTEAGGMISSAEDAALFALVAVVLSMVAALLLLGVCFVVHSAPRAANDAAAVGERINRIVPPWLLACAMLLSVAAVCLHAFAADIINGMVGRSAGGIAGAVRRMDAANRFVRIEAATDVLTGVAWVSLAAAAIRRRRTHDR
jgi:hypothetical protein